MIELDAPAVILSVRPHGEHGAIVGALTEEAGRLTGYVRGGRSRALRPVLMAGNRVAARFRARTAEQMPGLTVELVASRAPLWSEPLAAAGIEWVTALTAFALAEGQPDVSVWAALDGTLEAIAQAPSARGWVPAVVRFELILLARLGYGLALDRCLETGATDDLAWVSPKSGRAVSRAVGDPFADKLFALPAFLTSGGAAGWEEVRQGLTLSGHFLRRHLPDERGRDLYAARDRLVTQVRGLMLGTSLPPGGEAGELDPLARPPA